MTQAKTKAEVKPKPKKLSYWTHAPLLQSIEKHIQAGILQKSRGDKTGMDYLFQVIQQEFKDFFAEGGHRFTMTSLRAKFPELLWSKERNALLEQYISESWDLDGFYKQYEYLSKELVDARVQKRRGRGAQKKPAEHISGLFRLIPEGAKVKPFTIPLSDIKKPVVMKSDDANGLMLIHAPSIGLPYVGHMAQNPLRCALEFAERERMTVLFTGGLFHMRLKQAHGNTQNYRARTSSMDIDMEIFPVDYRETVKKGIEDGEGDFPIFVSLFEGLETLLSGVKKIFRHSAEGGGGARFTTPMYYVPGAMEEMLITIGAYHEIRYRVFQRRGELGSDLRELNALIRPLQKELEKLIKGEVSEGGFRAKLEKLEEQMNAIEKKLEAKRRELSKTIITNTHDQDNIHAYEKVRSFILAKLEDAMPGVKIAGYVSGFVKYKDVVIEVAPVGGETVSVGLSDKYIQSAGTDRTRYGTLPDAILLANQYSPHFAYTYITQVKSENKKTMRLDVPVMILPTSIDGEYVGRKFKERSLFGGQTKVQQMVGHPLFKPGIVVLDRVSGNWTCACYEIAAIQHLGGPLAKGETWAKRKGSEKYLNGFNASDLHFGHPWMATIFDPKGKRLLDQSSAVIEIFRKNKGFGRFHFSLHQDDLLQGLNFPNYNQPHANLLGFGDYQEYVKSAGKAPLSEGEYLRHVLLQKVRTGSYREQEQLQMLFDMFLRPNRDFFADVILTHLKSGVNFSGVSALEGEPYSSKDLGVVSFPNGNHHRNTPVKGGASIGEGMIVAETLKAYLSSYPAAKSFADRLFTLENNLVRAPMHGQEFLGLGVVDTKKGAKFGLHMSGHPARKGPANGYPLENAARNVVSRGDFNGIFQPCETEIIGVGDIHKAAVLWGPKLFYYSCPAATANDPYGDKGFAQSHLGCLVVSYPVEGVRKAPIRFTFLMNSWIESYFEKPFPVYIEKLIPNPA